MAKPKAYFTKGKGADREVHPIMEPKGQRITHSKSVHPSRDEVYDVHVQRRLQRIHSQRSLKAQRTDEALRAKQAKTPEEWVKQQNRRDVKGVDYPKGVKAKRVISEYNLKKARSAQETIDRLKREGHPYRGLPPDHPEVKLMIARAKLNKQFYEGKLSRDEWQTKWDATKTKIEKPRYNVYNVQFSYLTSDGKRRTKTWKIDALTKASARKSAERIFGREYRETAKCKILKVTTKEPKEYYYDVTWKNTEGKLGVSRIKANSKTEAYEKAKKYPLFEKVVDAKLVLKKAPMGVPELPGIHKPTGQQWNELSKEKRKGVLAKLNDNEKWADYKFNDLPKFVRDDLYSVTSGKRPRAEHMKALEKEGELMQKYSEGKGTAAIKGWKEWRKEQTEPRMGGGVSYNKATGWMRISFPDKPPKEVREGMKREGFRYKPYSKTWSAKWNPERQEYAEGLVGKMTEVDIKPNWKKKAENAEAQAVKHRVESNRRYDQFGKELKTIPFGQPILVGHHSEKSHRAHLKRLDKHMEIAGREGEIATKYEDRAKRYRRKAVGESPGIIYRRIRKLEAEKRVHEKRRTEGYDKEWHTKSIQRLDERLKIEKEKYNASGGIASDKIKFKKGDMVRTQLGIWKVVKVNPKTITVTKPVSGSPWKLKLDKSKIYGKLEVATKARAAGSGKRHRVDLRKLSLPRKPEPKVQYWITDEKKKVFIGPYPQKEAKKVLRKGDIIVRRKRGWIPPQE